MRKQHTLEGAYVETNRFHSSIPENATIAGNVFHMACQDDRVNRNNCMATAIQQLEAIQDLPTGWDSYGAEAPSESTIRFARTLLATLALEIEGLSKPRIDPTPSGNIQYTWELNGMYFEIEIDTYGNAEFFFQDNDGGEEEGEVWPGDSLEDVIAYTKLAGVAD